MNNSRFSSRRAFLQKLGLLSGAFAASPFLSHAKLLSPLAPSSLGAGDDYMCRSALPIGPMPPKQARPANAKYMGGFCAPKITRTIRVAILGCGARGINHIPRLLAIPQLEIVALCDVNELDTKRCANLVHRHTQKSPMQFFGDAEGGYIKTLKESRPDVAVICTPWEWHGPMACEAMLHGAHAFVEVPMAVSIDELWRVVRTSEQTQRHCLMLENCNYGREELMFLNMVRKGVIGDLLHGDASYIHELKKILHHDGRGEGIWRTPHYAARNGNLYPTHGLGPVAQYMSLARQEDNFGRLSSFSSPALNHVSYAKRKLPADHKWNNTNFDGGDMNTAVIKTVRGRTIMLQWDESSPRPYSRQNLIQGTLGTLAGFPTRVAGETLGDGDYHKWIEGDALEAIYEQYEHPLWRRLKKEAVRLGGKGQLDMGGHGGMDYVMFWRAFECLREGLPMDQNVYEGAFWSAVSELTEKSVASGGMPQMFPDFTCGDWTTTAPLGVIE